MSSNVLEAVRQMLAKKNMDSSDIKLFRVLDKSMNYGLSLPVANPLPKLLQSAENVELKIDPFVNFDWTREAEPEDLIIELYGDGEWKIWVKAKTITCPTCKTELSRERIAR